MKRTSRTEQVKNLEVMWTDRRHNNEPGLGRLVFHTCDLVCKSVLLRVIMILFLIKCEINYFVSLSLFPTSLLPHLSTNDG